VVDDELEEEGERDLGQNGDERGGAEQPSGWLLWRQLGARTCVAKQHHEHGGDEQINVEKLEVVQCGACTRNDALQSTY